MPGKKKNDDGTKRRKGEDESEDGLEAAKEPDEAEEDEEDEWMDGLGDEEESY